METTNTRTEQLRVNVTATEREELERIAKRDDRSIASVVRRAVREMLARESEEVTA